MLKRIPKSDINIRPFKVYKEWSFNELSTTISVLDAVEATYESVDSNSITAGILSGSSINKYSLFGQLRAQFYSGTGDNPMMRSGNKTNIYDDSNSTKERFLSGSAKVISIPQINVGEGIKKGSVSLVDSGTTYVDDSYGNLINQSTLNRVGNVFYTQGLIVFTRGVSTKLTSNWNLYYKSTKTIYENEFLLIASEDEFNVSTNPSAVITLNKETSTFVDSNDVIQNVVTNPGVQYIRKRTILENGNILDYRYTSSYNGTTLGGFEHHSLSSSVDTTGSFLTPFITTIGLYDDGCNLIAVAKLPKPIKSEPDFPINFIVRFDT
jgi:hypothetical protein